MNHSDEKEEVIKIDIIHIAGHCEFCGLNTDWPNEICGWCVENGFDKEDKKRKE